MTTRLLLVRHGATQLSAEDKFAGAIGVDLSEEGRAQAPSRGSDTSARHPLAARPWAARARPLF